MIHTPLWDADPAITKKINQAAFPGLKGRLLMHIIAAKAVAFGIALKGDPGVESDVRAKVSAHCARFPIY